MSTALFMAISGTLRPAPSTVTYDTISFVGNASTTPSAVSGTSTLNIYLPTGSVAGDVLVLTCSVGSTAFSLTWPTGYIEVVAPQAFNTSYSITAALYVLTSTDISNGYVTVGLNNTSGGYLNPVYSVTGFRKVDTSALDDYSFTPHATLETPPFTITATSVTAWRPDMLFMQSIVDQWGAAPQAIAAPSGWTNTISEPIGANGILVMGAYKALTAAGTSGSVSSSYTASDSTTSGWAALLIALKPQVHTPVALTLTGTLPAATVGTAWTGVLNFAGDYTGTLTVDASSGTIPAWMGTPAIDTTAKTVTWSGTPTMAKTESFTPRATSTGGQIAVGSAQSVVIAAASAAAYWDPTVKNAAITLSGTGNSIATISGAGWKSVRGATPMSSGKLYFEMTRPVAATTMLGISDATPNLSSYGGSNAHGWSVLSDTGKLYHSGSNVAGVGAVGVGDVLMCAYDPSTGSIWFGKSGTWIGNPAAGTGPSYTGVTGPLYACGSFLTDGGQLNLRVKVSEFSYSPPSGFTSLSGS